MSPRGHLEGRDGTDSSGQLRDGGRGMGKGSERVESITGGTEGLTFPRFGSSMRGKGGKDWGWYRVKYSSWTTEKEVLHRT